MIEFTLHKLLHAAEGEMHLKVDISVERGQLITIFGPSGAGKTSILRMLSGLMKPDKGQIVIDDQTWYSSNTKQHIRTQDRSIGYLFQDYALFPNMTVRENLEYAMYKGQDKKGIDELIDIVELSNLQDRKPDTLSGGQKQRVALARTLVRNPKLLLLDEPLSALDFQMRSKLQQYILEVHKRFGLTTILVSHDISEIIRLSDLVFEIDKGKILRSGKPIEIFSEKKLTNKFQFTGDIVHIEPAETIFIVSVLIGRSIIKVVASGSEAKEFQVGDKVLVASKSFNPLIRKI
jgi:molybdate transport system ATP-binding protein